MRYNSSGGWPDKTPATRRSSAASIEIESATKTGFAGPVSQRCVRLCMEAFGAGGCWITDGSRRAFGRSLSLVVYFHLSANPEPSLLVRLSSADRAPCRHRHDRPGAEMRSPSVRRLKKREQQHHEQCRSEAVTSPADDDLKPVRACAALSIRIRDNAPIHKKTTKRRRKIQPPCPPSSTTPTPTHFLRHPQHGNRQSGGASSSVM